MNPSGTGCDSSSEQNDAESLVAGFHELPTMGDLSMIMPNRRNSLTTTYFTIKWYNDGNWSFIHILLTKSQDATISDRISECSTISLSFMSIILPEPDCESLIKFRIIDELRFGISSSSGLGMNLIVEEGQSVR